MVSSEMQRQRAASLSSSNPPGVAPHGGPNRENVMIGTSMGCNPGGLEDESEAALCRCISELTTGCLPNKSRPIEERLSNKK